MPSLLIGAYFGALAIQGVATLMIVAYPIRLRMLGPIRDAAQATRAQRLAKQAGRATATVVVLVFFTLGGAVAIDANRLAIYGLPAFLSFPAAIAVSAMLGKRLHIRGSGPDFRRLLEQPDDALAFAPLNASSVLPASDAVIPGALSLPKTGATGGELSEQPEVGQLSVKDP